MAGPAGQFGHLATCRPELSAALSEAEFRAWYWLKAELILFCRTNGISPTGSKPELNARIADFLADRPAKPSTPRKPKSGKMPTEFTLDSLIGEGWRCGPRLGAFMREVLGPGFRFNAETRDFIHHGKSKTLADAALCYQESVRPGRKKSRIPEQLEYNRHFREFFRDNPGTSREEAIVAWWARRGCRKVTKEPAI